MEQVGLAEMAGRPIHTLSGGQKQRLAIAGALAEAVLPRDPASGELDYSCQAAGGCPGRLYARAAPNGAVDFACDRAGCDFALSL